MSRWCLEDLNLSRDKKTKKKVILINLPSYSIPIRLREW